MTSRAPVPATDYDPYEDENVRDPCPGYRMLRDSGPVACLGRHDLYTLSRHANVSGALSDWQTFTSADGVTMNDAINEGGGARPCPRIPLPIRPCARCWTSRSIRLGDMGSVTNRRSGIIIKESAPRMWKVVRRARADSSSPGSTTK